MRRFKTGDFLPSIVLESVNQGKVAIPNPDVTTHLQFRRFAGCPLCNLHLHQFKLRANELTAAKIQEVVVFHSSEESLREFHADTPFIMIADPSKQLYRQFSVQESIWAVAHPIAFLTALYAFIKGFRGVAGADETVKGLPAEFMINAQGEMTAVHYGRHGNDQWSVDDVILKSRITVTKKPNKNGMR